MHHIPITSADGNWSAKSLMLLKHQPPNLELGLSSSLLCPYACTRADVNNPSGVMYWSEEQFVVEGEEEEMMPASHPLNQQLPSHYRKGR